MYSTDLTSIDLDEFEKAILTIDLLPSRRILAEEISVVVPKLKGMDVNDLDDLRRLLRDKDRYAALSAGLKVGKEFLTVLNREVNSYVSRPVPLAQLGVFEQQELDRPNAIEVLSAKRLHQDRICGSKISSTADDSAGTSRTTSSGNRGVTLNMPQPSGWTPTTTE